MCVSLRLMINWLLMHAVRSLWSMIGSGPVLQYLFHGPGWLSELTKGMKMVFLIRNLKCFHDYPTLEKSSAFILHSSMKAFQECHSRDLDPIIWSGRQSLEEDREPYQVRSWDSLLSSLKIAWVQGTDELISKNLAHFIINTHNKDKSSTQSHDQRW